MFKNKRHLIIGLLVLMLLPPIIVPTILMSRPVVMRNYDGVCPAAPPDIPERVCTEEEYYNRIALSPFAFGALIAYGTCWMGGIAFLILCIVTIGWLRQRRHKGQKAV